MARIVREDRTQIDLRNFVTREIVTGVSGFDERSEIDKCFEFCRDKIRYRKDPVKVERVADLWSCLYYLNNDEPEGDCGIKSVALATTLSLIGYKPFFVVIRQNPMSSSFNHVYCGVELGGKFLPLDPTPEDEPAGFEYEAIQKAMYPIFT